MKKIINVVSFVVLGVILAVMAVGCGGSDGGNKEPLPASIELVPQGVDFVGEVKLSPILEDPVADMVAAMYSDVAGTPQTLDAALDMFEEESGLDLRDCNECVLFGKAAYYIQGGDDYTAVIAKGDFEESSQITSLGDAMEVTLDSTDYKGYVVYTDQWQEFTVAFLRGDVLVFGTMQPVKDVIDVLEGDKLALSGSVLDAYNELGDVWAKLVWEPTPEMMGQLKALAAGDLLSGMPVNIEPLLDIQAVALVGGKEGDTYSAAFKLLYPTSDAAQTAQTTLNGLVSMLKMAAGMNALPTEGIEGEAISIALDVFEMMEISSVDSWLTIGMENTLAGIQARLAELQ